MPSPRTLLLAGLALGCALGGLPARAQGGGAKANVAGRWEGYLVQGTGPTLSLYRYAMVLFQEGTGAFGTATIREWDAPEHYAVFAVEGTFEGELVLRFDERAITEQRMPPGRRWCLKSGALEHASGPVRRLEGAWTAPGCVPGRIMLVGPFPLEE